MTDADKSRKEKQAQQAEREMQIKLKRLARIQKRVERKREIELKLLNPKIKDNLIEWKRKEKNKNIFEGFVDDVLFFEIKPGIRVFSLKLKDVDMVKHFKKKN